MHTKNIQPIENLRLFNGPARALFHEPAYDDAAQALLGLERADLELGDMHQVLAFAHTLDAFPVVVVPNVQRITNCRYAVDFTEDSAGNVHLLGVRKEG